MCQMCEYKKDARLLMAAIDVLNALDFDNLRAMTRLSAAIVQTAKNLEDGLAVEHEDGTVEINIEAEVTDPGATTLADFEVIIDAAEFLIETTASVAGAHADDVQEVMERFITSEDMITDAPPVSFADFLSRMDLSGLDLDVGGHNG